MTIRKRGTLPFRAAAVVVTLAAACLSIEHPYGAQAVAVDRGSRDYTLPDQMQWRDTENGKTANLYGDPSKPGLYAYILKRGPNVWSKPHFHDNDRFVTVLEGPSGLAPENRSSAYRAVGGRLVREDVAGGIHFDGTKDDGATLYFVGIGPSPGHPAEPSTTTAVRIGSRRDRSGDQADSADREHAEGIVVLYGDSSKPGLYLQNQRRAPNTWSRPHYHPIDRVVMVIGGTMRIGTEPSGDRTGTVGVTKGGFIRDIAQGVHFDGPGRSAVDSDCRRRALGDYQCRPTEVAPAIKT